MSGALDPGLGGNSGFSMMGSPIAQRPPVDRFGLSKRLSSKRRLLPQQIASRSRWVFLRKIKLRSTLTLRRGSDGSRRFKSSPLRLRVTPAHTSIPEVFEDADYIVPGTDIAIEAAWCVRC